MHLTAIKKCETPGLHIQQQTDQTSQSTSNKHQQRHYWLTTTYDICASMHQLFIFNMMIMAPNTKRLLNSLGGV